MSKRSPKTSCAKCSMWSRKFEKDGNQELLNRRGKWLDTKPNLMEAEALQLKLKQLEERNNDLALLK